jgi:predicted ATPase
VTQAVASTLGVREAAGRSVLEALSAYLQNRHLLLILDNCEHLIEACARLAEALLRAAPKIRILATSREALQIDGEATYPVPTLGVPPEEAGLEALSNYEAARLFVERAASARPGFALASANAPAVAVVCRRLDGIPLALELAAARVRVLSVEQIAGRLDDRFGLLTGGSRTALPRHRTLRATVDWSYELLSEPERVLLRRLSVFAGGWTLEAAEAVCAGALVTPGEVLDLLAQLANKSLVVVANVGAGDGLEARYRLLETIRQYAAEKLTEAAEEAETRDRHLDFCLDLVERHPIDFGASDLGLLRQLSVERDNMRAALEWAGAAEGGALKGLRLAAALGWYWHQRSDSTEGRQRLAAALDRPEVQAPTEIRARALAATAELAYRQTDLAAAKDSYEAARDIYLGMGPAGREGVARTLMGLGEVATEVGDYVQADALFEESLQMARDLKHERLIGNLQIQLGWSALRTGAYELAAARLAEAQTMFQEIDWGMALALSGLGEVNLRQGNYEQAIEFLSRSAAVSRQLGNNWGLATVLGTQGWAAQLEGDFGSARALLGESLHLREEIADKGGAAWCLERLAEIAASEGRLRLAAQTQAAAAALRASVGSVVDPTDQPEHERKLAALRVALGDAAYEAAWAEGQKLELSKAIEQALAAPSE